ncbi:hypothetical protein BCR41DRAFT_396893 [Lobosporangium transversale]|uniref:Uncharacterized protein n=1 Tax=Lobosporangium transversale TaxID=64571 RepID=A0A1Y2GMU0_9FUNG|nr:hypothetical protein BCR41DRAFT_396893 [Lobosporangium transversale]ORZ14417.1 hypothetical protein BCR41DRAFT_396893 [Lobosporangium transversale]|eukprot:XP_021880895.1 hypothetical protein BCR41DRAFT_396893 [Lobosporangium transversale]
MDPVIIRLESVIKYSLDRFQFRNATFLAERLQSQVRGHEHSEIEREHAQYLLATCHYRQGKPEVAWTVLERCASLKSRYLFAQCCLDLKRYVEAAGVLEWLLENGTLPICPVSDIVSDHVLLSIGEPDRASVLNLLGHTARAQQRHKLAIKYFKEALSFNPLLWEAFEGLCELGAPLDPNALFQQFDTKTSIVSLKPLTTIQPSRINTFDGSPFSASQTETKQYEGVSAAQTNPFNIHTSARHDAKDFSKMTIPQSSSLSPGTIMASMHTDDSPPMKAMSTSRDTIANAPGESTERVTLRRGTSKSKFERSKSSTMLRISAASGGVSKREPGRSNTIANFSMSGIKTGAQRRHMSNRNTKKDTDSNEEYETYRELTIPMTPVEADQLGDDESLRVMIDIFRILARSYGLLSLNQFIEAITEFETLPHDHLQSGWVQCQLGKCKFGMVDYASAMRYFERARELDPSLHKDMEIYSTCLWHLNKETMLSTLAKELKDSNLHSPQAWVALGNAFSLKHDSEQALKCFQRAIQLNDRFAYAHTLSGHEYTYMEEYDKAQTAFLKAMAIDPRHYYAWFGVGLIYDKMGKNDLALVSFKEAHKLNPSSSVVLYRVGASQEKLSRITEALRSYQEAIELDSTNVAARFSKAKVQADMGYYDEAYEELEIVMKLSPDEPNAFMLLGKVLQKKGDKAQALKYLTYALNLNSKLSHTIRDMIEKLEQDADNDEVGYDVKVDVDL